MAKRAKNESTPKIVHGKGMDMACNSSLSGTYLHQFLSLFYFPTDSNKGDKNRFRGKKESLKYMTHAPLQMFDRQAAVLDLVAFVVTDKQWKRLCENDLPVEEVYALTFAIEQQAMRKMMELEVEVSTSKPPSAKSRHKALVIGLGTRVVAYLKHAKKSELTIDRKKATKSIQSFGFYPKKPKGGH